MDVTVARDRSAERRRMVDVHIAGRGVRDPAVLRAMREVPRERFVEPGMDEFAYEDSPLPIGEGQTISQPYIVALMIEAARLGPDDEVLEVGAGSGYAAAVLSRIVHRVHAIERHPPLAEAARRRLRALGYDNVTVVVGDGTRGLPDRAPFDAILVAAGAPETPATLREQLAPGGRLVIPVGDPGIGQRLRRITRTGADEYRQDDLGGVSFVPLIGEHGWRESGHPGAATTPSLTRPGSLARSLAAAATPLPGPGSADFGDAFAFLGDRRVVLLGESTHGTSEFYRARAAITRTLIERHGFTIVALEADWPDAAVLDRAVRGRPPSAVAPVPFQRFPRWMWRNREFSGLLSWMRRHDRELAPDRQAGLYGLDIYNMSASIATVLAYLDEFDPEAAAVARERYGCLTPWQKDPATYGRAMLNQRFRSCEDEVVQQCRDMFARHLAQDEEDRARWMDAAHSARLVASAEAYYRVMYYGNARTWNLRDTHMFDTLEHLLSMHGPESKAVVWAHNSHIGDARHTEMGIARDEINVGQLCRQRFGDAAALVGFGTHEGTVAAAEYWDGDMHVMDLRPSHRDSIERVCHDAGIESFLLGPDALGDARLGPALSDPMLERFVGVIYRPETEFHSHYAEVEFARQFDAYVWFERSHALSPLPAPPATDEAHVPDTFPFGE